MATRRTRTKPEEEHVVEVADVDPVPEPEAPVNENPAEPTEPEAEPLAPEVREAAAAVVPDELPEPEEPASAVEPAAPTTYRARARVRIPFRVGNRHAAIEAGKVFTTDSIPFDGATMELLS